MTELRIRPAEVADAEDIAGGEAATALTPGLLVGRPGEISLDAYRAKISNLATPGFYLVAEEWGRVVGHAFLDPMAMAATSHVFRLNVVVYPDFVGRGIGTALVRELMDRAAGDARVGKVELLVRAGNERAIRLYRRCGFTEEGRLRRRIRLPDGSYLDDIAMAWFPRESPEGTD